MKIMTQQGKTYNIQKQDQKSNYKMGKQSKHGQDIVSIDRQLLSEEYTFLQLSRGDLKGETEIISTQDQALQIKYHATKFTNRNRQKMQVMSKNGETMEHSVSSCQILQKNNIQYKECVLNYTLTYARKQG